MAAADGEVVEAQAQPADLRAARRPEHAAARHLRGADQQSQPGGQGQGHERCPAPPTAFDPVVLPGSNNPRHDRPCLRHCAARAEPFVWWWIAIAPFALLTAVLLGVDPVSVLRRRRHLGHRLAGDLGLRHHQLCLVDRHRHRRHVHLGAVLSDHGPTGAPRSTASPRR